MNDQTEPAQTPGPVGLRINGRALHVWKPGLARITRCGLRVKRTDTVEDGIPVPDIAAELRCRKCFPGSGR